MITRHRLLSTLPVLLMLLMIAACATSRTKLDGVWECVKPAPASADTRAVKILTDGHFAFGRQSVDGGRAYAGGGTYRLDGTHYIETVDWHWVPVLVGQTIVFDCALKDGLVVPSREIRWRVVSGSTSTRSGGGSRSRSRRRGKTRFLVILRSSWGR